jgi:hypothetical protein
MIARTVHGAVPHEQLLRPVFAHFIIPRKQINGKPHIMNIDALPCYRGETSAPRTPNDADVPVGV